MKRQPAKKWKWFYIYKAKEPLNDLRGLHEVVNSSSIIGKVAVDRYYLMDWKSIWSDVFYGLQWPWLITKDCLPRSHSFQSWLWAEVHRCRLDSFPQLSVARATLGSFWHLCQKQAELLFFRPHAFLSPSSIFRWWGWLYCYHLPGLGRVKETANMNK